MCKLHAWLDDQNEFKLNTKQTQKKNVGYN